MLNSKIKKIIKLTTLTKIYLLTNLNRKLLILVLPMLRKRNKKMPKLKLCSSNKKWIKPMLIKQPKMPHRRQLLWLKSNLKHNKIRKHKMLNSCKISKKLSRRLKSKNVFLRSVMLKSSLRPNNRQRRMHLLHNKTQIKLDRKKNSLKRTRGPLKNK